MTVCDERSRRERGCVSNAPHEEGWGSRLQTPRHPSTHTCTCTCHRVTCKKGDACKGSIKGADGLLHPPKRQSSRWTSDVLMDESRLPSGRGGAFVFSSGCRAVGGAGASAAPPLNGTSRESLCGPGSSRRTTRTCVASSAPSRTSTRGARPPASGCSVAGRASRVSGAGEHARMHASGKRDSLTAGNRSARRSHATAGHAQPLSNVTGVEDARPDSMHRSGRRKTPHRINVQRTVSWQ